MKKRMYWTVAILLLMFNMFGIGVICGQYIRLSDELSRAQREIRELDTAYRNLDRVAAKQCRFNREILFAKGHKKRADNEWPILYRGKVRG